MRKRLFILLASTAILLPGVGGWGIAAQLDGLELRNDGDKVQVILDVDKEQAYQIQQSSNAGYRIILPKAKLPTAFQETSLPPVVNPEIGVTANIHKSDEGVQIELYGSDGQKLPYEVRFRSSVVTQAPIRPTQPKPPLTATKPGKPNNSESRGRLALQPKKDIASQPKAKVKPTLAHLSRQVSKPVIQKHRQVATHPVRTAPQSVQKSAKQLVGTVTPPPRTAKVTTPGSPAVTPNRSSANNSLVMEAESPEASKQLASEPQEEGIDFLAHAQELGQDVEAVVPEEDQALEASSSSQLPALSDGDGGLRRYKPSSKETLHRGILSGAMLRWIFISIALVGGLILMAVSLAFLVKRRVTKSTTGQLEEYLPSPSPQEYFEAPLQPIPPTVAKPEIDEGYLPKASPKVTAEPHKDVVLRFSDVVRSDISRSFQREAFEPVQSINPIKEPRRQGASEDLLVPPSASISDAVRSSLGGGRANPYLSSPFRLSAKPSAYQGGPKSKQKTPQTAIQPSLATTPGSFAQFLQNQS